MNPIKTRLALGLAAALTAAPVTAADSPLGYLNMTGAVADMEDLDNGLSGVLGLGFPLDNVDPNLSIEGEFSKSLIGPESDGRGGDRDYFSLGGFAAYRMPVTNSVALRGRAGLVHLDWENDLTADDELGMAVGVGATWRLQGNFDLLGELTIMDTDPDLNHFSVGVQYWLD
ncbi:Outer membrane protein beta-barrel domain-containing protein [Thiohalospira halophila DSM 15071]|uniref:Outer membrane protein beta-barrel domain-containing protein n=1 Tax=Thiohalospira halophila DSM 15071 TaxID=1123397 RepID=A0A1I1V2U5_9GAMM|nr:outer membrane beta-barrel protein [Thiohalospira halophila]SFD77209.1 Outer membrane protein beta-barrel domain-containing protein [Thiohalospira halophila DSM 15071]